MHLVAIDPGGMTGWAEWVDGALSFAEIGRRYEVELRVETLLQNDPTAQVVCESFIPRPNVTFVPDSLYIIGTVEFLIERAGAPALILQSPAQAKSAISDKRLKEYGWWDLAKGAGHARDAARHLAVQLVRRDLIRPRTGEPAS